MDEKEKISASIKEPLLIYAAAKVFTWVVLAVFAVMIWGTRHFGMTIKHTVINWDAIWYLKIAMEGYNDPRKMAFFPLFPGAIKAFSLIIRDPAWAALAASNIFGFTAAVSLYNLARKTFDSRAAVTACLIFSAAPTAIFFTSAYTEPLFLTLSSLFFIALYDRRWMAAALLAGAASCCRNTGVILSLIFVIEYFRGENKGRGFARPAIYILLSVCGLAAYMVYLYLRTGDPFYFISVQELWHSRARMVFPLSAYLGSLSGFFSGFGVFDEKRTTLSVVYYTAALLFLFLGIKKIKGPQLLYYIAFVAFLSTQPYMMSFSRYLSSIPQFWLIPAVCLSGKNMPKSAVFVLLSALLIWQVLINLRWMAGFWVA
jgi:hypothetical protein